MICRALCVFLFVAWTAEAPHDSVLYSGHWWRSPFVALAPVLETLPVINLSAWQVLLLALAPISLAWPGAFRKRPWPMYAAILASLASVTLTWLWGLLRGGSVYAAYFQLWHFLAALLVGVLLLSVVRTPRDLKALGLTILMAALVRGTLAIYFYWAFVRGKIDPPPPYMTTHDDSLLFVAGLLITLSWALARARKNRATWLATVAVWAFLFYAISLNNRRLAWLELSYGLAVMYFLLPRQGERRRVNRWLLLAGPVLLVYFVVGWNRTEAVFGPARALSTSGSDQDASSLARLEELRNLAYTLTAAGNPLLGTGWGRPYLKVTSVYANFDLQWWLYLYTPHNSLLGVAVFGGLVGICGIWLVVPVAAFLATRGYREATATETVRRAAAMTAIGILPAYGAQCYGDVGFQSLTCNLILGVALAVAGKVAFWAPPKRMGQRGARVRALLHERP